MQRLEFVLGVLITIESEQANGARAAFVSTDRYESVQGVWWRQHA